VGSYTFIRIACAFTYSTYSTSNPLLAETFEIPELKFIAEKVSHNPVVMAYHAEGEGWELYATSSGKTKFWGTWDYERTVIRGAITHVLHRQKLRNHSYRHAPRQDRR
jgi:oxysterol-binding protein